MKWSINSVGEFYDCGESMVVYFDSASGDTHLLSNFAAYLIQQMGDRNRSLEDKEIIALIKDDIEPEALSELTQALPEVLRELASLDIVASD